MLVKLGGTQHRISDQRFTELTAIFVLEIKYNTII